jgi:hypothetical protein
MGSFEHFTTKTHFISLKRQVVLAALAMLVVKLVVAALGAAPGGSWLDLLARPPPSVADLGAALLVFEVLRARRAANRAARAAVLVAASPVLFVASGVHGDPLGVAVCLLLLGMYLLVGREAPLAAGIAGLPDRGPEGRILVVSTRHGSIGFLVDEVVRVMRYDPALCRAAAPNRLGNGYVTASFQGPGGSWPVVDWDAIRLPAALTAR